jgi:hypothetical protein
MPKVMLVYSGSKGTCTACHGEGLAPLPADHAERSDLTCAVCHGAAGKEAAALPHSSLPLELSGHSGPGD